MEVTDKNNAARGPQDATFRPTTAAARAPFRKRKCTRGQRWFSRWWPSMCWCPAADGCSEGSWQARPRPAGPGLQLAGSGKVSPGDLPGLKRRSKGCFLLPPCSPPSLSFRRFRNAGDAWAPRVLAVPFQTLMLLL